MQSCKFQATKVHKHSNCLSATGDQAEWKLEALSVNIFPGTPSVWPRGWTYWGRHHNSSVNAVIFSCFCGKCKTVTFIQMISCLERVDFLCVLRSCLISTLDASAVRCFLTMTYGSVRVRICVCVCTHKILALISLFFIKPMSCNHLKGDETRSEKFTSASRSDNRLTLNYALSAENK